MPSRPRSGYSYHDLLGFEFHLATDESLHVVVHRDRVILAGPIRSERTPTYSSGEDEPTQIQTDSEEEDVGSRQRRVGVLRREEAG